MNFEILFRKKLPFRKMYRYKLSVAGIVLLFHAISQHHSIKNEIIRGQVKHKSIFLHI